MKPHKSAKHNVGESAIT